MKEYGLKNPVKRKRFRFLKQYFAKAKINQLFIQLVRQYMEENYERMSVIFQEMADNNPLDYRFTVGLDLTEEYDSIKNELDNQEIQCQERKSL